MGGDSLGSLTGCALEVPYLLSQARCLLKQERTPETLRAVSDLIERAYTLEIRMTHIPTVLDEKW